MGRVMHGRTWWLDLAVAGVLALVAVCVLAVWHSDTGDIPEYHQYAQAFWLGMPRFSHLPAEYPPLALLPFSLTLLPLGKFSVGFVVGSAIVAFGLYYGVARWAGRRVALIMLLYLLLAEAILLTSRFDLYPACLTVAALWATERQRWRFAYLFLVLGALVKIYPLFLIPLVLIAEGRAIVSEMPEKLAWQAKTRMVARRILRDSAAGLATLVGVLLFALWRAPTTAFSAITYAAHRPMQIEAPLATLAWLGWLFGIPTHIAFSYGSVNLFGPLADALAPWSMLLLVAGCGAVYALLLRGTFTVRRAFLAALGVIILTGKVFSPQYIVWILPFAALEQGLDFGWLILCMLQVIEFSVLIGHAGNTPFTEARFAIVAGVRNLLLLVLVARLKTVGWLKPPARIMRRSRAASPPSPAPAPPTPKAPAPADPSPIGRRIDRRRPVAARECHR
jgi:hypothetical protein